MPNDKLGLIYKIKEIDLQPVIVFSVITPGYRGPNVKEYIGKIKRCLLSNEAYRLFYEIEDECIIDFLDIPLKDIDEETRGICDKVIKLQEEYYLHHRITEKDLYGPKESRRETPEQFQARTGKPWKDGNAVYMQTGKNDYFEIKSYREAKLLMEACKNNKPPLSYIVYCANSDAGIPRDFYDTCGGEN